MEERLFYDLNIVCFKFAFCYFLHFLSSQSEDD
jgi:hypothetical protein